MILLPILARAESVEIDGIYYNLITKGQVAEVTSKPGGYVGDVVIPKTVTHNGVEYTITTLGAGVSLYLDKLNSISIPPTVNTIKDGALLTFNEIQIYITDLEAWFNINFDCPEYPPFSFFRLFLNGTEIEDLTIPQIKQITNYLFSGCKSLKCLTIPSCVDVVGDKSFWGCTNLSSLTIENGVSKIGNDAFRSCSGLSSVNMPNSVKSIGSFAFKDCTGMESITLSNSLEIIGESAFEGCCSLSSITIPNGVTYINNNSFFNCSALNSVSIPSSVTSIGEHAFGCSGLTSVTIPNSVTSIGKGAFTTCGSLTSVTIPNSVTSISSSVFSSCTSLTSITIPSSVNSIGGYAFYDSGLTSITIPISVKSIEEQAFGRCENLTEVYSLAEKLRGEYLSDEGLYTHPDAFKDSYPQYMTIHAPAASIETYRSTVPWSQFKAIMALDGGDIPEIQKCATPEISYANGKLDFTCETEGVEFVSEVTTEDVKKYYDASVTLSQTYKVTVYATKAGYENSDVATRDIVVEKDQTTIFGDINKDGNVNVTDVVKLLDIIMNK